MRRVLFMVTVGLLVSCKGPMAKVEAMRDGLAADDMGVVKTATDGFPACKEPFTVLPEKGCFQDIATAFGSKTGFNGKSPDQASAATVALVVVREGRADWFRDADVWFTSMRSGKGPGADALRLAVARQMASAAPDVGKKADEERDALPILKGIGESIPGACATYTALASGVEEKALPVEMMADHSPCVQKDLGRKDGPGGTYGHGIFRASEGAVALWKDASAALRDGLAMMDGAGRKTVETKLAAIDDATKKIALKKQPKEDAFIANMNDVHGDAGVPTDPSAKSDAGPNPRAPKAK